MHVGVLHEDSLEITPASEGHCEDVGGEGAEVEGEVEGGLVCDTISGALPSLRIAHVIDYGINIVVVGSSSHGAICNKR
jgi:hypothetical protein